MPSSSSWAARAWAPCTLGLVLTAGACSSEVTLDPPPGVVGREVIDHEVARPILAGSEVMTPDTSPPGSDSAGAGAGGAPRAQPAQPIVVPVLPPMTIGEVRTESYDFDDVRVYDTQGKKLDKNDLVKRLSKETVAVASLLGDRVDLLHLRCLTRSAISGRQCC